MQENIAHAENSANSGEKKRSTRYGGVPPQSARYEGYDENEDGDGRPSNISVPVKRTTRSTAASKGDTRRPRYGGSYARGLKNGGSDDDEDYENDEGDERPSMVSLPVKRSARGKEKAGASSRPSKKVQFAENVEDDIMAEGELPSMFSPPAKRIARKPAPTRRNTMKGTYPKELEDTNSATVFTAGQVLTKFLQMPSSQRLLLGHLVSRDPKGEAPFGPIYAFLDPRVGAHALWFAVPAGTNETGQLQYIIRGGDWIMANGRLIQFDQRIREDERFKEGMAMKMVLEHV